MLERLHRKLKKDGILAVLKKGLEVDNAHLDLLYRLPYNDLNPDVKAKFESNRFSIEPIPKPPQTLVLANEPTARSVGAFARMRGFGIGSIMREIAIPAATV